MPNSNNSELTKRINAVVMQAHINLETDSPSIVDETIVAQHRLLEQHKETIDSLRSMLLEYGFEKQIMETRLEIARKEILQFKEKK